ncbi:MAG: hypothetical protein M1828_003774 [Chrysothrix sp. TS-e1954]|nr:MAG: hypothetical protein M1828_003774 [Chrysothrix sp. TS-e1954]
MDHIGGPISLRSPDLSPKLFVTYDELDALNTTKPDFNALPARLGWKVLDDGTVEEPDGVPGRKPRGLIFDAFVQKWLYFEVLREMFYSVEEEFAYEKFVKDERGTKFVHTENLGAYLKAWNEKRPTTYDMVRLHKVLIRARYFVSQFCSASIRANNRFDTGTPPVWAVNDLLALSIMTFGESLTRAVVQLQNNHKFWVRGWCESSLSERGWGYSEKALYDLKDAGLCARTLVMLEDILKGNTVGLLFQNVAHSPALHWLCTPNECKARWVKSNIRSLTEAPSAAVRGIADSTAPTIPPVHMEDALCDRRHYEDGVCELQPTQSITKRVSDAIMNGNIPLFCYDPDRDKFGMTEMSDGFKVDYAVFSHVWTDGFGNEKENKINTCVARYLARHCKNAFEIAHASGREVEKKSRKPHYFWIDTWGLPIGIEYQRARNKAVGMIHRIYWEAAFTIVIDTGLSKNPLNVYSTAAMRITISQWITRLWCLQEAVLSKELYFVFSGGIHRLNEIEEEAKVEDKTFHKTLAAVGTAYSDSLMSVGRLEIRKSHDQSNPFVLTWELVARVWRAVQWRRSAKVKDETLALAILLGLDTDAIVDLHSRFNDWPPDDPKVERCMRILLDSLNSKGAIPAGMIFLPGEKLSAPGYRWAPRSWLSDQGQPRPDLSECQRSDERTRLQESNGLMVSFPGFLLHQVEKILSSDREAMHFPVNIDLHEWYHIKPVVDGDVLPGVSSSSSQQLAIVAIRLPLKEPQESALLVELDKPGVHTWADIPPQEQLNVKILTRVWLSMERDQAKIDHCREMFENGDFGPHSCGEQRDRQLWCIDGSPKKVEVTSEQPPLTMLARRVTSAIWPGSGPENASWLTKFPKFQIVADITRGKPMSHE